MKELIRKLYIQTSDETADGLEWALGGLHNAERFAELIVKECISMLNKNIDNISSIDMNDWQCGRDAGIKKCIETLNNFLD